MGGPGNLRWQSVDEHLVASPVWAALTELGHPPDVLAADIDPSLADTTQFCDHYAIEPADSANCVVIVGRRGDTVRYAACVVLATTRADVNGVVRRRLDARKASFAAMSDAVELTGMEYGGITPIGLPGDWPVFIDSAVLQRRVVVVGSGVRRSKIAVAPQLLAVLPAAQIVDGLAH